MSTSSPRPPSASWKDTWLWETLLERKNTGNHASSFIGTLEGWMEKLDTVLRSGGTSPLDFTLHDERHSLRVADRMQRLLTDEIQGNLSDYEIALLLLAAYGHDIGMTPERNKVQAHHRHLLHPDQSTLTGTEKLRFQKFLDEWQDQPVLPPLSNTPANLDLADELTAFYVRDCHNEWSAEWLREKLVCDHFGSLPNPVEILIRLCSSHHWSFERLRADDFDPIFTHGSQPQFVHLRYLACILRLADILENDPERTPKVLYEHRDIEDRKKSLIYWRKDHAFNVDIRENQLHFHARPPDAHVHKALEELADWIDHELNGIASFGDRLPIHNTVGSNTIRRKWHLTSALTRDIKPFDASYEYIEGAFRPDTARLLQLLSNEQLYGNPLVAVRELLQNAFDAIREKIARKRLEPHIENPADRIWEERLGNQEQVTLTLKPGADGGWLLICEDTGVGLTKALITGHLLVSGHTRRHAILDLERRCEEKGFRLGRTGQFGIGVLSYFMLADEVEIQTTRAKTCGDDDGPGWSFTTRGVGSFGELRKLPETSERAGGTHIRWMLRPAHLTDPSKFAADLLAYLREVLIRIPCRLAFITEGITANDLHWQRPFGWVKTGKNWLEVFQNQIHELKRSRSQGFGIHVDYLSDERAKEELEHDRKFQAAKELALSTLRCEIMEFDLPHGAGLARYVLAYHELPDGRCVSSQPDVFKDDYEEDSFFSGVRVRHFTVTSWKGMRCSINPEVLVETQSFHLKVASVEINIENVDLSSVSISRKGLNLPSEVIVPWEQYLVVTTNTWVDQFLSAGSSDQLHEVNLSLQERHLDLREGAKWFHFDGDAFYRAIRHPMALPITQFGMLYKGNHSPSARLTDSSETPVAIIAGGQDRSRIKPDCELRFIQSPESSRQAPCLYWPTETNRQESAFKLFPSEWNNVGIVHVASRGTSILAIDTSLLLLNRMHPMISLMQKNDETVFKLFRNYSSSIWQALDEANTPELAVIALCRLVLNSFYSVPREWETYSKQRSKHLDQLWMLILKETAHNDVRLIATNGKNDVEVNPNGLFRQSELERDAPLLPRVTDPNFLLHVVP